jgi:putative membrane protein
MKRYVILAVSVVMIFGLVFAAYAADKATSSKNGNTTKSNSKDGSFVKDATIAGLYEVEAGRIGTQKASNSEVKSFAQKMVDDHSKANSQLKSIVDKKGISAPTAIDKKHQGELDKLNKVSADKFDKSFMDTMVKDHKKVVSMFDKEAKSGKDAELKAFASETVSVLREHERMAKDLDSRVKKEKKQAGTTTSGGRADTGKSGSTTSK